MSYAESRIEYWMNEFDEANQMVIELRAERDSAIRERDEAMAKLRNQTFGDALLKFVGRSDLPFLVRAQMVKAVKGVLGDWELAGSPTDIPILKQIFRRDSAGR